MNSSVFWREVIRLTLVLYLTPGMYFAGVFPTAAGEVATAELSPGERCVITADLECVVREVSDETVLVEVTALREAEHGVPLLEKLPYPNRLFKNVGVARTEMKVILELPRDCVACVKPDPESSLRPPQSRARPEPTRGRVRQVMIEFKAIEIPRDALRNSGVEESRRAGRSKQDVQENRTQCILDPGDPYLQVIERCRNGGQAKVLAEPTLVAAVGRPASFRSGGEFPISVPKSDGRTETEFREFGTRVDVVVTEAREDTLRLEVRAEISEREAIREGESQVPGLRMRKVDTAAELRPGQTLVLRGLIQGESNKAATDAPACNEKLGQTEVVILITPTRIGELSAG